MRFIALFLDDIQPSEITPELTKAHFDYLSRHTEQITDAGGLRVDPENPFCGSLWVIEAASTEEAQALADADPYCEAGLRPDYRVLQWNKAPLATRS